MADPVVGITNGVPTSGTGTITTLGQTLVDGAQVTQGAIADAAVTAGATGTISAKLRSISRDVGSLVTGTVLAAGAAIVGKIGIDQTTDGTTNLVRLGAETSKVIGTVNVAATQLGTLGQTTLVGGVPVSPASNWVYNTGKYVAVAASQTDAAIQASLGAAGDYLDHVIIIPATTAPGVVTIKDNATALISYPGGGTTPLLTLTPFTIFVGAISSSGAWKITTGANVSVLAVGRFS